MKWKPYPKYKDSGVEWLGTVPEHWEVAGLTKYIDSVIDYRGRTPPKADSGVLLVTARNVREGYIDYSASVEFTTREAAGRFMTRGTPKAGDVLLAMEAPLGQVAQVDREDIVLAQRIVKLRGQPRKLDNAFLKYWILSAACQFDLAQLATGSTALGIKGSKLVQVKALIPPLDEQQCISAFIESTTPKVDTLMAKQERLIELLQEKRQALISHVVTKGLNPAAPMKPSSIEWLGDVPAHWRIVRLKNVAGLQSGLTLGKDYGNRELEMRPYLRVANVQDGFLDLTTITEIGVPCGDAGRYELRSGDVLMTEGGDFDKLGRGFVWSGQIAGCLHQNHVFAMRPKARTLNPLFLARLMTSDHGKAYFTSTSQQTTNLASTNSTKILCFPIPLPPYAEQLEIIDALDRETAATDRLVQKAESAITLMREHRAALISAAVTGKIDVREPAYA